MAEPTVVDYQESTFSDSGTTDETSASVTWETGDIVLVFGGLSNNDPGQTMDTPTVSGLTFSLQASVNAGNGANNDTTVYLWSATAASAGSGTISAVTNTTNSAHRSGIAVLVYRGSDGIGTPVTMDGSSAKTISVTRAQANSHVAIMLADWNQVGDVTVNATPTGTVRHASAQAGQADFFVVSFGDQGATGTTSYGITDHTGTVDMSGIAVEIKGTSGDNSGEAGMDGTGTMTMSGASEATADFSMIGSATMTMVGAALADSAIASDGSATVDFNGLTAFPAAFSMDGSATMDMAGAATASADASMDGAATVDWVGQSTAAADFSSDGASTIEWVGQATAEGAGDFLMSGTGTMTMEGASLASGDLGADGVGDAAFVGAGGAAAEEEEAPTPGTVPEGLGGAWPLRSEFKRRQAKREDEEIVALIKALAPDLMQHKRRVH